MRDRKILLLIALAVALSGMASAQALLNSRQKKSTVCYGVSVDNRMVIPPPKQYLDLKNARSQTTTFVVTYTGFTPEAKAAFQKAVDIWSTLITSSQTIRVSAEWKALSSGVLGSAIWGNVFANFPGAPQVDTYYPVALAEKIANKELNPSTEADIVANFSSTTNWSYDLTGTPASGKYDLVTVVLHELGHGLGFVDSYTISDVNGIVGLGGSSNPIIYDLSLENNTNQNLFINFVSPSTDLANQLKSKNIFCNSPQVLQNNSGVHAKIYAPATFSPGSSISHLDETTFNPTANALMTPQINTAEVMHDPGPIVKGLFSDMGWVFTRIEHNKLLYQESTAGPFVVKAKVISDLGTSNSVFLNYNTGSANTQIPMTLSAGEYSATIPTTNAASTYAYYISTSDALRSYTNPGKSTKQGAGIKQTYFTFKTGPDTEPPVIVHTPKEFIRNTDTELIIESNVTDNLGVEAVRLEYLINDIPQPGKFLVWSSVTTSLYSFQLTFPSGSIHNGDILKYRIAATDTAVVGNAFGNKSYSPSLTTYYSVKVIGLQPVQDYYFNDFNSSSSDFYGEGFSITTPSGFSNPCINSEHPYKEGQGFADHKLNTTYQLFTPIRVKAIDATIKFDEIVLVEPGKDGAPFGTDEFYDYVVVEGSSNGGTTWLPIADGYDSRDNTDWLTRYNRASGGKSIADPSLYKSRVLNLLSKFTAGQEVIIRFRLFSDPLTTGWGWAIDNLKIQIDDTPPQIRTDYVDYILPNANLNALPIQFAVTDPSGIKSIVVEYKINDRAIQTFTFSETDKDSYSLNIDLTGIAKGDKILYRITATDKFKYFSVDQNNTGSLPSSTEFITVVVFEPSPSVDQYVNDFNVSSNDFIGNYFSINKPDGFTDASINSDHFYSNGVGLNLTSSFTYMLTKPVTLNASNPHIRFDEIAVVEGHGEGVTFGNSAFNDYVIVEGSSDGGVTWMPFLDGYDAVSQPTWLTAFNAGNKATKSMFKTRTINMMTKSGFRQGDHVLVRFRLFSNQIKNGWGWAIDNLSIQGAITGEKNRIDNYFKLYPNPSSDRINIELDPESSRPVTINLISMQGRIISEEQVVATQTTLYHEIDISKLPAGLYIIKVQTDDKVYLKRITVTN